MSEQAKINCPGCGTPMNHHADKLVYAASSDAEAGETADSEKNIEVHSCPSCGGSQTRCR